MSDSQQKATPTEIENRTQRAFNIARTQRHTLGSSVEAARAIKYTCRDCGETLVISTDVGADLADHFYGSTLTKPCKV